MSMKWIKFFRVFGGFIALSALFSNDGIMAVLFGLLIGLYVVFSTTIHIKNREYISSGTKVISIDWKRLNFRMVGIAFAFMGIGGIQEGSVGPGIGAIGAAITCLSIGFRGGLLLPLSKDAGL